MSRTDKMMTDRELEITEKLLERFTDRLAEKYAEHLAERYGVYLEETARAGER